MKKHNIEELYDDAIKMYASGHNNVYIELQFAEQGVDKATVKEVIDRIKKVRKNERRVKGYKIMIGGMATVAVGVIFTLISYKSESPIDYVLYGLIIMGIMSFVKGLLDIF